MCDAEKETKYKIILLVREPISRSVSGFFQNMQSRIRNWQNKTGNIEEIFPKLNYNRCIEEEWFKNELEAVFDIDVFAHPFHKEEGYTMIEKGNVSLLLMKMEKLSSLEKVIGDFVQIPDFKLEGNNIGNKKEYRFAYEQFWERVRFSKEHIEFYYNENRFMDHFFTEEEKKKFLS